MRILRKQSESAPELLASVGTRFGSGSRPAEILLHLLPSDVVALAIDELITIKTSLYKMTLIRFSRQKSDLRNR